MNKLKPETKYCLCSGCGLYFTTETTFDMHRQTVGDARVCVDPALIVSKAGAPRLKLNNKGYWGYPGRPPSSRGAEE